MNIAPIRVEVIEARRRRKGGAIVLALALLLIFGEYSSKVRVTGQLVYAGGAIKALTPQFGRIVARHVREGESVKDGQLLFDLSAERIGGAGSIDARISTSLAMRREQIVQRREATLQQLALRAAALADQERLVKSEMAAHLGGIAIADELVRSARASVDRNSTLAQQGFVSVAMLAQQRNILNVERARRNALMVNLGNARSSLLQVRDESASLAAREKIARTEAEQSLAVVEQEAAEHEGRRTLRITAPVAGTITALAYDVGQSVQAGTVLATVLPKGSLLEAKLMIPSQAKSSVAVGQQVQMRIDAFPYQRYGLVPGSVKQVELNPINDGAGAPGTPDTPDIPVYRATVAISTGSIMMYGKPRPLEPGMTLEADVFHDRRKLIEWIVDPVVSAVRQRPTDVTVQRNE